jgi:hypothetical protein
MLVFGARVFAAEMLVETVAKGCNTEIEPYFKNVTSGEGRILACLYAHEDKLSGQCEYASRCRRAARKGSDGLELCGERLPR